MECVVSKAESFHGSTLMARSECVPENISEALSAQRVRSYPLIVALSDLRNRRKALDWVSQSAPSGTMGSAVGIQCARPMRNARTKTADFIVSACVTLE